MTHPGLKVSAPSKHCRTIAGRQKHIGRVFPKSRGSRETSDRFGSNFPISRLCPECLSAGSIRAGGRERPDQVRAPGRVARHPLLSRVDRAEEGRNTYRLALALPAPPASRRRSRSRRGMRTAAGTAADRRGVKRRHNFPALPSTIFTHARRRGREAGSRRSPSLARFACAALGSLMPAKFEKPRPGPPKAEPAFVRSRRRSAKSRPKMCRTSAVHTIRTSQVGLHPARGIDLRPLGWTCPCTAIYSQLSPCVRPAMRRFSFVSMSCDTSITSEVIEEPVGKVLCKIADVGCFRSSSPCRRRPFTAPRLVPAPAPPGKLSAAAGRPARASTSPAPRCSRNRGAARCRCRPRSATEFPGGVP